MDILEGKDDERQRKRERMGCNVNWTTGFNLKMI